MLIHFWADYGLFTQPEMPAERVTYPVPPWPTVRGMLEAIFWKHGVVWVIKRVYVLRDVRRTQIMRNELLTTMDPTQRRSVFLVKPEYVIDADPLGKEPAKFLAMAADWVQQGRRRVAPFMGTRECMARFGPPPADFMDRARLANRRMPPLERMPVDIQYHDGNPVNVEWAQYRFDHETGSYYPERTGGCLRHPGYTGCCPAGGL